MRYFQFKKLVRDGIPEQMRARGQRVEGLRRLEDAEFLSELRRKVVEEAAELAGAESVEEMKKELADVREALDSFQRALLVDETELDACRREKAGKSGAFETRSYIEAVGVEEGSEWYEYYLNHPDRYPEVGSDTQADR